MRRVGPGRGSHDRACASTRGTGVCEGRDGSWPTQTRAAGASTSPWRRPLVAPARRVDAAHEARDIERTFCGQPATRSVDNPPHGRGQPAARGGRRGPTRGRRGAACGRTGRGRGHEAKVRGFGRTLHVAMRTTAGPLHLVVLGLTATLQRRTVQRSPQRRTAPGTLPKAAQRHGRKTGRTTGRKTRRTTGAGTIRRTILQLRVTPSS